MVEIVRKFKIVFVTLILAGCSAELSDSSYDYAELISTFDFESADQLWDGGISDYPADYADSMNYIIANDQLAFASSSVIDGNGLSISAENPYGDIFYYFKKKILGFKKNTTYKLDFEFLVHSQLNEGRSIAVDEDIFLKVGAVDFEPELQTEVRHFAEYVTLNVDKGGSNADSGTDMVNMGSIKEFIEDQPGSISGNTFDVPIEVQSDSDGAIWLIIGVDSGVKSSLTFSLAAITVYYTEILG